MDNRQQSPSRALKITPILGLAILCLLSLQALLAQSSGDAHVSSFNNAGNSAPSNTASNPVAAPTPPTPNPTPNPTPDPNQIDTDGDGVPDVQDGWHVDEWEMLTLHYGETLSGPRYPSYGVSACFISIAGNAYGSVSGFARINWKSWCQLNAFQGCIWNNSGTNDPNFRS